MGLCVLVVLALTGCARLGGEALQPSLNAALPLTAERTVGQTFTVAGSGIVGFDLLVATYGAPADPAGRLLLTLRDDLGGDVVDQTEVPGTALTDNAWVAVDIDGRSLRQNGAGRPAIEVTWEGTTPVALRANVPDHPIDPDVLLNDPYPNGELVLDGELAAGDLAFRVRGADGVSAAPRTAAGLVRGAASGLRDQPLFAVTWGLALLGCLALAVWGLRGGRGSVRPSPAAPDQHTVRDEP